MHITVVVVGFESVLLWKREGKERDGGQGERESETNGERGSLRETNGERVRDKRGERESE